ncbi:serine hydrolase domain-containing protein [Simiduia agarivorans]|uniref:Hydrolase n=1 Tax=Simiduia agarivorans (strain DSM 21679 / JCM 13881 / BCRC 17597 / SA1) TaxID=1117647 RepID=K4KXU5_SIMAS|nr:serine hydrolase domain-containing protein [Simiduia agarivorans]AFU98742.1 putative hydrolase [Simiduia agarivorans SA1 = DSM 21679]
MKARLSNALVFMAVMCLTACGGGNSAPPQEPPPYVPYEGPQLDSASLNATLEALVQHTDVPVAGVQLALVVDESLVYAGSAGHAHFDPPQNLTPQHALRVASVSKWITALAIGVAVERGLLAWDQPVESLLNFSLRPPAQPDYLPTLAQLLSHTSGLSDAAGYVIDADETLADWYQRAPASHWQDTVITGNYFQYANLNYVVAATALEAAVGMRFDQWVFQMLLQPAGVQASFNPEDLAGIATASLFRREAGAWVTSFITGEPVAVAANYQPGMNGGVFSPQGGLRTSVAQLAKLIPWLYDTPPATALLSNSSLATLRSPRWQFNGNNGDTYGGLFQAYGLGVHCTRDVANGDRLLAEGGLTMCGHLGDAYGAVTGVLADPVGRWGLVYLINGTDRSRDYSGEFSALYVWEEALIDAAYTAIKSLEH